MRFDLDMFTKLAPGMLCILGLIYFAIVSWSEDPIYTELVISGIYTISSFLLWIVVLLVDLNAHFKKLEKSDD